MANQICAFGLRQINPTGKSLLIFRNGVKPRNQKYSAFAAGQISARTSAAPCPQEVRFAIVTDVGLGMRATRQRQPSDEGAGRLLLIPPPQPPRSTPPLLPSTPAT